MKRYIRSATYAAEDIEELLYRKLDEFGISDTDIYSVSVSSNSERTFKIEIVIKKHRKKFKITGYYSKAEEVITKICYQVNAWLKEGDYVLASDTYVALLKLDNIPIGYYKSSSSGRGRGWAYIVFDPNDASRFERNDKRAKKVLNTDEWIPVDKSKFGNMFTFYFFTPYHITWNLSHPEHFSHDIYEGMQDDGYIASDRVERSYELISIEDAQHIQLADMEDLDHLFLKHYIDEYLPR